MVDSVRNQERQQRECDPEVIKRRNELFQKYVMPYKNMIYKLVMQYSWNMRNVRENYNEVLVNFYRGIETYDPSRSIKTWLHICTKRCVLELERKCAESESNQPYCDNIDTLQDNIPDSENPSGNAMNIDNYRDFYNDDILQILDMMKPIHRDALLLQQAGYSLKEIADIEYKRGTLKSHNIETVKSRLYLARQFMKKYLTRDGERKVGQANNEGL
jgi:RNA polymerase sigma factor (sigma-70 family)